MKVFLAGLNGDTRLVEGLDEFYCLESFHYRRNVERALALGWPLFLDSGAFSAYTVGAKIDLNSYISFIREHEQELLCYAALDSLDSPEDSLRNYRRMLDAGLRPILTYHYRDPWSLLEEIVRADCPLAIGGVAQIGNPRLLLAFFMEVWARLQEMPSRAVHGFAVTSFDYMRRFPWSSVDSTVWVKAGAYGKILHPETGAQIFVDPASPYGKEFDAHIDSMPIIQRERLEGFLLKEGFTLEQVATDTIARSRWNIRALLAGGRIKKALAIHKQQGLFDA